MSSLQWALLLLGVGIALALVVSSLREKRAKNRPAAAPPAPRMTGRDWEASGSLSGTDTTLRNPGGALGPAAPVSPPVAPTAGPRAEPSIPPRASFDEFGVGKPRRRVAPEVTTPPPGVTEPAPAPKGAAPAPPLKLFGLYIAEYEGTNILGPKIHAALQKCGLTFGAKKIYHRVEGGDVQFSVASLVKPGSLDPAESEGFATPGLSVFMLLPGPRKPVEALSRMLDTARALAKALNAELYDSEQRAPLTPSRELELRTQVEEWAKRSGA